MIDYQVIHLENDKLFDNSIDLSLLDDSPDNIFIVGIKTLCKLEGSNFPIKNRKIAMKQILTLIRYIDTKIGDEDNCVEIYSGELIKIFNRNSYVDFMKLLNELNIIQAVPYNINGSNVYYKYKNKDIENDISLTKRYKLNDDYNKEDLCIVIISEKNNYEIDIDDKYNKKFINTIKEVEIDIKSAIMDEIKNMTSFQSLRKRLGNLFLLFGKRFIKKGIKVNRVYHSLSNISRISRKYLTVNGIKFNSIDIVNCQPLLLCYYLIKNGLNIDYNYILDCQKGNLYESFMILGSKYVDYDFIIKNGEIYGKIKNVISIDGSKEDRDKIKKLLYKSIYFDFKPDSDIAIKFKEIYPNVYLELKKLYDQKKDTNDCKMAGELQNIEAEIFNDLIPNKSKYYFTLFDAIYFTSLEDVGQLVIEINKKFNNFGLSPTLDIK